jgi:hypothetical protein
LRIIRAKPFLYYHQTLTLCDFEKFVKKTPNFRIKIGEDIQRELDILVKHGVVKVRDKK